MAHCSPLASSKLAGSEGPSRCTACGSHSGLVVGSRGVQWGRARRGMLLVGIGVVSLVGSTVSCWSVGRSQRVMWSWACGCWKSRGSPWVWYGLIAGRTRRVLYGPTTLPRLHRFLAPFAFILSQYTPASVPRCPHHSITPVLGIIVTSAIGTWSSSPWSCCVGPFGW